MTTIFVLFYKRDILVKIIDLLENKEWSDSELENMLMEFRYDIADAKTFYLVGKQLIVFIIL